MKTKNGYVDPDVIVGLLMISLIILLLIPTIFLSHQTPSKGQHTIIVTAVEENGFFWKTKRVYVKTDGQSSQEESYCVIDPAVEAQLEQAQVDKKLITVEFQGKFFTKAWECDGEPATIVKIK